MGPEDPVTVSVEHWSIAEGMTNPSPEERRSGMTKYVYFFGAGRAEGSSVMRNLLGGKGCELAEMTNLGIPVPPGFTITTQAWVHRQRAGRQWPEGRWEQSLEDLERLEQVAEATVGERDRPALRRSRPTAPCVGAFGRACLDARDDGNDPEPRAQRRDRRGAGVAHGQRALRLGLLPALHHDVFERGAGSQA